MAGEPIVTIVGNVTSDPKLRYVNSGTAVADFTVASTPRTQNRQTGQWEDGEAMFVRCSVWRDYAEHVAQTLTKGMRVIVQGRMTVRTYESNGSRGTSIEMNVDEVGPSLRFATAQVTRATSGGSQGGSQASYEQNSQFGQASQGPSYNAPMGGAADDEFGAGPGFANFSGGPRF